jgi:cyclase
MIHARIIPVLLAEHGRLVKSVRFRGSTYIGDPVNTIRIFNEKTADELIVLDIGCSRYGYQPDVALIRRLASECFMPLCYGGGIGNFDHAKRIFESGVEKVAINSGLRSGCLRQIADVFGSQSVVYSLDVRRNRSGEVTAYGKNGMIELGPAADCAQEAVEQGVGELILHSIDREGTFAGYDLDVIRSIASSVPVPVIACGGARDLGDFSAAIAAGASAVAAGSQFVFVGRLRGVLISYPDEQARAEIAL